jgi:Uncharacterised protein family UPF0547
MEERTFKGYNGNLVVSDTGVRITGGAKRSAMTGTLRGEKFIPWESIVPAQYRGANLAGVGYLQLSLRGGSEAKGGLMEAVKDENTVTWSNFPTGRKKNREFAEARDLILAHLNPATDTKVCPECAESIKVAANVCRFCGYRFESPTPDSPGS